MRTTLPLIVDGEERRRAVEGGHPTGAGVFAWRERSLLMALLVPAHATSKANPRLPRQPCCSHRSCCVKHHQRDARLLNCFLDLNLRIQNYMHILAHSFSIPAAPQLALAGTQTLGTPPLP
jgi:hypothetical protein